MPAVFNNEFSEIYFRRFGFFRKGPLLFNLHGGRLQQQVEGVSAITMF